MNQGAMRVEDVPGWRVSKPVCRSETCKSCLVLVTQYVFRWWMRVPKCRSGRLCADVYAKGTQSSTHVFEQPNDVLLQSVQEESPRCVMGDFAPAVSTAP